MKERRYNEDEVAAIFANAANAQEISRRPIASDTGMTLAELQEIGREVGIAPDAVAQSAELVDQRSRPTGRSFLGLPVSVGITAELGRTLTEAEWERLVVDLRETFEARGKVSGHGSFRQWTNGNLQALLEPTDIGHRLRLQTIKGSARGLMMAGIGTLGAAAAMLVITALGGNLAEINPFESIGSLAIVGI